MLFFRSEEHIHKWCEQWNLPFGAILSLDQGWRLAQAWYAPDRRDPTWRRKNPVEIRQLFDAIGLAGDFWVLG
jgi:hypothetical protein